MKGLRLHMTALAACCTAALGQAEFPVAFVANNGNLEGSVSSFAISENAAPIAIQKRIIGSRGSTSQNARARMPLRLTSRLRESIWSQDTLREARSVSRSRFWPLRAMAR